MQIKQGAKIAGIRPEIIFGSRMVESVFEKFKISYIITEVTGAKHGVGSLHPKGQAIDIRSKHIIDTKTKLAILAECKAGLNEEFDFILESLGKAQEHYHLEYDPK